MASSKVWQPVKPNTYIDRYGKRITIFETGAFRLDSQDNQIDFGPKVRLCQLVPAAPPVPPDIAATLVHALDYYLKCEARLEYANGKITYEPDAFYQRISKAREWLAAHDTQGQEE